VARPIVGITGGALTDKRQTKQRPYRDALHAAGAVPILLRPEEGLDALDRVQAVLIPGGGDIDPRRYGSEPKAEVRLPDAERDEVELEIAREAVARGMPLLGICRGIQIMTVALGGTLHQHVPELPAAIPHEGEGCRHEVRLEPACRLARIVGAAMIDTNSSHHQAAATLPPLLERVGVSGDGVIEAVEGPGFTIGVEWHPERDLDQPHARRLFEALVDAASKRL
jgi:gamma-glutamyl-gamma-aminobutyrate hydrolase PuuD